MYRPVELDVGLDINCCLIVFLQFLLMMEWRMMLVGRLMRLLIVEMDADNIAVIVLMMLALRLMLM